MADKISPQGYVIGLMPTNNNPFWGDDVPTGQGIPAGGNTGEVLTKKSDADYDVQWAQGGGGGQGPAGPAGPAGEQGPAGKNAVVHRFNTPDNYNISVSANGFFYTVTVNDIFNGYSVDTSKLIDVTISFTPKVVIDSHNVEFGKINITLTRYGFNYNTLVIPVIRSYDNALCYFKIGNYSLPTTDDRSLTFSFVLYKWVDGVLQFIPATKVYKTIGLDVVITEEA